MDYIVSSAVPRSDSPQIRDYMRSVAYLAAWERERAVREMLQGLSPLHRLLLLRPRGRKLMVWLYFFNLVERPVLTEQESEWQ